MSGASSMYFNEIEYAPWFDHKTLNFLERSITLWRIEVTRLHVHI